MKINIRNLGDNYESGFFFHELVKKNIVLAKLR